MRNSEFLSSAYRRRDGTLKNRERTLVEIKYNIRNAIKKYDEGKKTGFQLENLYRNI